MDELNPQEPQQEENKKEEPFHYEQPEPVISPITAGFIGLFGGFVLYQFVGGFLTILVLGFDIDNAPINSVRLMTMAGQVLFLLLPALILTKIIYQNVESILRIKLPNWKEILLFTAGVIIITPLLQSYLYIQNHFVEQLAANSNLVKEIKIFFDSMNELVDKTYSNLLKADNPAEAVLIIFVIAITPAFCEEFLFRGFIQKSFELKFKPFWGALITAVFFGIFHLNPYGLLPLIALGLYFGYAAYMSNSIFIPVILHFLNNFAAVILFFIYGDDELISATVNSGEDIQSAVFTFFFLLFLFAGVILLIRYFYSKKNLLTNNDY